jgi:hypothetical protein
LIDPLINVKVSDGRSYLRSLKWDAHYYIIREVLEEPDVAESDDSMPNPKSDGAATKRSTLKNFLLAIKHVNEASLSENVKQRFSDYVTIGIVIACILSLLMAVSFPVPTAVRLLPLLFTVLSVVFYIVNRLGIMISLTPRQALIVWQILVAGFWLGVTSAMLVMLVVIYFFAHPT